MEEYRKYEPLFGSWYLSKLLGKGSFGKVFEITREEYGTTYKAALKVITVPQDEEDIKSRLSEGTDMDSISEYYEGILREIINENQIMAQLKGNSNIVSYEDHQIIPHEDGIGYDILIRMELLTPLLDRMMKRKLTEKEVVKVGIDICKALELCHRKNIIHRDIKPQNIFLSESGDFKLGDFGIARTIEKTTSGMSKKGTYKYMAPEVFRGENYGPTVDLYSLGIVLYSLLNGNRGPFLPAPPAKVSHTDEENARMRRLRGENIPDSKDAGPVLAIIIRKACAFDPQDRYQSAEQMRIDLESYLANYDQANVDPEATVKQFTSGAGLSAGSYNTANTGSYDPVNTGSYNPANTSSYNPANTSSYNPANTSSHDAVRTIEKKPQKKKTPLIAGLAAVVILLAAGIFLLSGNSKEDRVLQRDYGCIGDETSNELMTKEETIFGSYDRDSFKTIMFLDTLKNAPDDAIDVSETKKGKVLAWIEDETLYIAAKGGVIANSDSSRLFAYCNNLEVADFNNCFDTESATLMNHLFYRCDNLREVRFDGVDTGNVTSMQRMFVHCQNLTDPGVSDFDTKNVNTIYAMFRECTSLQTLDLSKWDTSKVSNMARLFESCTSLAQLEIENFDTSYVTSFRYMFYGCSTLTDIDVSGFNTSNSTDMKAMFSNCFSLSSLDISSFDTSNVVDTSYMFHKCGNLPAIDVSAFDVSNVKDAQSMFYGCREVHGYEGWGFDDKVLFGHK